MWGVSHTCHSLVPKRVCSSPEPAGCAGGTDPFPPVVTPSLRPVPESLCASFELAVSASPGARCMSRTVRPGSIPGWPVRP